MLGITDITDQLFEAAAAVNADTFEPHLGKTFIARPLSHPDVAIELRLNEVTRFPERKIPEGFREQFSLLFDAIGEKQLSAGELCTIYKNDVAWMILFVNPVIVPTSKGSKIQFESAFA